MHFDFTCNFSKEGTLKQFLFSPFIQGSAALTLTIFSLIIFRILHKPIAGWNSAALMLLLYCALNAIIGISVTGVWIYLLKSIGILILLYILAFALSSAITGMSYGDYGENAMIFVAPVLYYPVFLAIMGIIRLVKRFL